MWRAQAAIFGAPTPRSPVPVTSPHLGGTHEPWRRLHRAPSDCTARISQTGTPMCQGGPHRPPWRSPLRLQLGEFRDRVARQAKCRETCMGAFGDSSIAGPRPVRLPFLATASGSQNHPKRNRPIRLGFFGLVDRP